MNRFTRRLSMALTLTASVTLQQAQTVAHAAAFLLAAVLATSSDAQSYRIERIASGLSQPTFVTQAPGDPVNILYFTERTSNTIPGFSTLNQMGKVWRYDVATRTKQLVLDLSNRQVTQDTGLHTIAFHPDFDKEGTTGHRKMYVTLSESNTAAINKLEEYKIGSDGMATFQRLILQYTNNVTAIHNHTIGWAGFDPTASGEERNYLYVSTGDGSFGNNYNGSYSPGGRPSQNLANLQGKMLRIDVDPGHSDAYPSDPLKNFAIPASNPIPAYNAARPGSPVSGAVPGRGGLPVPAPALNEIYVSGLRNTYRASFDRSTGDLWMGDVGENRVEEISFLKADSQISGPPADYGWPQREGADASLVSGAPHNMTNPFTGFTSLNPIQQRLHSEGDFAWIGGYVHRGPIDELFGKYVFGDFVSGRIYTLDFDRDTDPSTFNANNGVLTDVTSLWKSLVFDPTDPVYPKENRFPFSDGLDSIVSFGEDNAGNLYLFDFGTTQYPNAGQGEIFRVTPIVPEPATIVTALVAAAFGLSLDRRRQKSSKAFRQRICEPHRASPID